MTNQQVETVSAAMQKKHHQGLEWTATRHLGGGLAPRQTGALVAVRAVER